jgi:D-aminoacyl-tRNA deacylase
MRAVVQRVSEASVSIRGQVHARIGRGLMVLLGVETGDSEDDLQWLCGKITRMRIFPDGAGVMNLDLGQVSGDILLISQFTLHASTAKGNRPSYIRAARPEEAAPLYERAKEALATATGRAVQCGVFGADMQVALVNDGPVTITMDSKVKE